MYFDNVMDSYINSFINIINTGLLYHSNLFLKVLYSLWQTPRISVCIGIQNFRYTGAVNRDKKKCSWFKNKIQSGCFNFRRFHTYVSNQSTDVLGLFGGNSKRLRTKQYKYHIKNPEIKETIKQILVDWTKEYKAQYTICQYCIFQILIFPVLWKFYFCITKFL